MKPAAPTDLREDFALLRPIETRWADNDVYGHVNNVVYYSYFDTVINRYLIEEGGLDVARGASIGLCVDSQCRYLLPVTFPERLEGGLRVAALGNSSVRYDIGIFVAGRPALCALGAFTHVFVDRVTRRPVPMPERMRAALSKLQRPGRA